jgi:hypothetical protein
MEERERCYSFILSRTPRETDTMKKVLINVTLSALSDYILLKCVTEKNTLDQKPSMSRALGTKNTEKQKPSISTKFLFKAKNIINILPRTRPITMTWPTEVYEESTYVREACGGELEI